MKKIILSLVLISFLALPVLSLAQSPPPSSPSSGTLLPLRSTNVINVLENVVDWLFTVLLIFAAIFIVIAGFQFVTAQGDPEKVKKARDMILYAIIGIVVALLARGIIYFAETIVR